MIWYPYQQMKTMTPPHEITHAKGVYLYTKEGERWIDSLSSWWSVIHGYGHPEMDAALIHQLQSFSHVMLGGLSHGPVQQAAEQLASWLPGDLNHCFFSDSGSVGVEVALKMALQFFMNQGDHQRTTVLALNHAYHGDTFKAMEVGDDEDYHFVLQAYGKSPHVIHIPTQIPALREAFAQWHHRLCCMIVEPLLQGAGGMQMYDLSFLQQARALCDQYGVLLIFDEVATGFGRTGHRFVSDLVLPDIVVLGKALTGGYLGHAVTVASGRVYQGFYSDNPRHALMHGPTFMGNALACRAILTSMHLFDQGHYLDRIHHIEQVTRRELEGFTHPEIREIRILGGCVCIEVLDPSSLVGYQAFACQRGVFSRPFLKYLYAMVPYVISDEDLITILNTMKEWFHRPRNTAPRSNASL